MNVMSRELRQVAPPRRVEALAYIIERLRKGVSPSYAEIGRNMRPEVGEGRARQYVDQLVKLGVIERDAGSHRGISIRDFDACRGLIDAALGQGGWVHAAPLAPLKQPSHCRLLQLPLLPLIELPPDSQ